MSLAKLRLSPYYSKLAKFQASEEGGLCLEGLSDSADIKSVRQICNHLDFTVEFKDGIAVVKKPGHDFFDALDVAAPGVKDQGGLSEYVARGDLVGAEKLANRGVVSQSNLFTALLALPQGASAEQACGLLRAASATAEWPSKDAQLYFEKRARQATVLFLGEGKERLEQANNKNVDALVRSGRCQLDVMLSDGRVKGEILVGTTSTYSGGRGGGRDQPDQQQFYGRGLLAGDCVAIRPMDGGHITECEVVVASPLILRPMANPPPGTTGSGRTFRVDGLANRQQFARALTAVHLSTAPPTKWGNCIKDRKKMCGLAAQHRPSDDVLGVLFGQTRAAAKFKASRTEPPSSMLQGLNSSQKEAMAQAAAKCFALVQGPPGTGKTTVAVRILKMWASSRKDGGGGVLCASDSNIAVDNVVEGLAREGVRVVRVGRPEAARPEVLEHTAEEIALGRLNMASVKEANMDASTRGRLKEAVQQVISEAEVVCCTAVGSGSVFLNEHRFSRVLVDEAAQAMELVTLVPICRGASQVVLCGDQCQLPPTIGVDAARNEGLEVSLFERLATSRFDPLILLRAQHRMHPAISAFSRSAFYAGRLMDGIGSSDRPVPRGFRWPKPEMPVCFLPTRGAEQRDGDSFKNEAEAEKVLDVIQGLLKGGLQPQQVGIVTPYAAQVRLLRAGLARMGLPTSREKGGVETNSVDGYQGREKEAIVMSTVRSSSSGGLGFVADWRRANVAFTRARCGLVVVGDPNTLGREPTTWAPWLRWVRRAGCYSPRGSLDALPSPVGEAQAVGLSTTAFGEDAAVAVKEVRTLLDSSAKAWADGGASAADLCRWRSPSRESRGRSRDGSSCSDRDAKRRKVEEKDATKKDKKLKKAEKKEKKREKKQRKKDKKLKKKAKNKSSSSGSSSSSS